MTHCTFGLCRCGVCSGWSQLSQEPGFQSSWEERSRASPGPLGWLVALSNNWRKAEGSQLQEGRAQGSLLASGLWRGCCHPLSNHLFFLLPCLELYQRCPSPAPAPDVPFSCRVHRSLPYSSRLCRGPAPEQRVRAQLCALLFVSADPGLLRRVPYRDRAGMACGSSCAVP